MTSRNIVKLEDNVEADKVLRTKVVLDLRFAKLASLTNQI